MTDKEKIPTSSKAYLRDLPAGTRARLRASRLRGDGSNGSDDLAVDPDDFDRLQKRHEGEGGLIIP
jgi:hypothetical protein